ncbi:MAG: hypothetical protein E6R14_09795 [Thermomicrobiales bacterium]|nr:MAG: hypothetical protein E6R14_09795 [Thermomicrobiales bacterium]
MWRAPLRGFLLVLVVAGVAILSLGLWARYTIYDQDQFVSVVSGLSEDPVVQQVAIERTMAAIDQQVTERTATQALSPTIAITYQMFRPQIESGITAALQSPRWEPIWEQVLRELHDPLTDLLKGNDTPNLVQTDNEVQFNLFPLYEQAKAQLDAQGITLLDQLGLTRDDLWVSILKADTLIQVQEYVRLFNRLLAVGIIVSVLAAVGYVLLSNRKLRAMAWLVLAIGLGWLIQRAGLEFGKRQLVNELNDGNEQDAAQRFYDTLVGDLRSFELWALIAAVAVAAGIYLFDRFYMQKRVSEPEDLGPGSGVPSPEIGR